jgi:hypothetical protein
MNFLPFPLKIPLHRVDVHFIFRFVIADEVEPQRDATISSSNMKPVKWVEWSPSNSTKYESEPE